MIEEEDQRYELEYRQFLKTEQPPKIYSQALSRENRYKNRYSNVLPADKTRVKLSDLSSDYINANYIRNGKYIATQGPLNYTQEDFWKMIWQNNCSVIVMLCQLTDPKTGREKCHRYWPTRENKTIWLGNIKIKNLKTRYIKDHFEIRTLEMKKNNKKTKKITHIWYKKWEDFEIPESDFDLLIALSKIYDHNNGPITIHCSAGIGRTGTFLATLNNKPEIPMLEYIAKLRQDRPGMLQTPSQYSFACKYVHKKTKKNRNRLTQSAD